MVIEMKEEHVFKAFSFFYKTKYNELLSYSERSVQLCKSFVNLLKKQYGSVSLLNIEFLQLYFQFQFQYWSNCDIKSFNGKITLSMIIGKKAFDRFLNRDQKFDFYIKKKMSTAFFEQFKKYVNLQPLIENKEEKTSRYDADEIYREEYLNEEKGLSNCIVNTSLYDPHSKSCNICKYIEDCRDVQKQMYRKIYENRKIDGEKSTR